MVSSEKRLEYFSIKSALNLVTSAGPTDTRHLNITYRK